MTTVYDFERSAGRRVRKYGQLRETHPRIGKAAYGAWYESDMTGLWDGRQVDEILRHDESTGRCAQCGGREDRSLIRSRTLVGLNAGDTHSYWSVDCREQCGSPGRSGNYTPPWN